MSAPAPALVLHGTELSGHTRRVENLLHMLGLPYRPMPRSAVPAGLEATP